MDYHYAIVETGGGFDCSFGVGIQKALLQHFKVPSPSIRIGSSGSAITTSFLTAGQENIGYSILTDCLSNPGIVKKGKFIDEIDIEKLVNYLEKSLDLDTLITSPHTALLALTEYETGNSIYVTNHDPESREKWFHYMKASMAMPLSFRKKIMINGIRYIDGDVAGSLWTHIEKALSLGAKKVIAINNYSPGAIFNLNSMAILGYMSADQHHRKAIYKRIRNDITLKTKIEKLKDKVIFLAPTKSLPTGNFNNTQEAIQSSITIGFEYALKNKELRAFISQIYRPYLNLL